MTILALALAAVALTAIIRGLIPLHLQMLRPFSCDLCMAFWCGWVAVAGDVVAHRIEPAGLHALLAFLVAQALPVIGLAFILNLLSSWLRDARGAAVSPLAQSRSDSTSDGEAG